MSRFKDFFKLVGLAFYIRYKRLLELIQTIYRYYNNKLFRQIDRTMFFLYLFDNPYTAARKFATLQGEEDIYTYGETPLTTLEQIVKRCGITANDTVYELGSGRGRSCFWLHCFVGCKVVGIEYNPHFYRKAEAIRAHYDVRNVTFVCEDLLKVNYSKATVVYLYGSCLEENFIFDLIEKLRKLPVDAKIITVSYPLTDYTFEPLFELIDEFDVPFTWGTTTVYVQVRTGFNAKTQRR
ncbi:MAG: class I SAM-dependent methyltransferase [Chlamydiales bacterium]|nr:class I SAM-dependent methyltransferase [Chlamydiales bacterium]